MQTIVSRLVGIRHWKVYWTLAFVALVLVCATPYINYFPSLFNGKYWTTVMRQVNDPFVYQPTADAKNPQAHESKKTFRLTVPMIARVLHLNEWGIYGLQFLIGIVFVFLIMHYVERRYGDASLAFLTGLGATSVYFGIACFTDVYTYFSGWAYFFLFAAICFKNPYATFAFAFLAAWTDERAVVALSYVMFYWQYVRTEDVTMAPAKLAKNTWATLAALGLYGGLRLWLQSLGYHVTPPTPIYYLYLNLEFVQLGTWTILEGFWFLVLYKYYVLWKEKKYAIGLLNLSITGFMVASSYIVWDVTRSGSFIVLEVFLSMAIIHRERGIAVLRRYTSFAVLVSVLFPAYYMITNSGPFLLQRSMLYYAAKHVYKTLFM